MALIGLNRDLRVDFFRGVALWWIFVDHIPANWVSQFSLRNFALCDSTEVFVLLAGYAAGIAYGRNMDRYGWLFAGADTLRRAWILYVAHIFLFVVFSAQVSYSATALDRSDYLEEIHLDALADAPYRAMLEALLLGFQPAYLNILPMYIVLLAMFTAVMPLLRAPAVLLFLSGSLYVAARSFSLNLPNWEGGGWYFNPLTWQLLFMVGALLSYRPIRFPGPKRAYDVIAAFIVLFGVLLLWLVWPYPEVEARVPAGAARILLLVDKEGLHPMRLLSIFALTWLVARAVPAGAHWLRKWPATPFVLCGQHSLPVFCAGIFLSFLARLAMEVQPDWTVQAAVNVLGSIGLLAVGALAAWYRHKGVQARTGLPATKHAGNARVI